MKITHYCNSFLEVTVGDTTLVCDPWVGLEENNAWATYPIHKDNEDILNRIRPDAIYISHLHFDHFDRETLSAMEDKSVRFFIKTFRDHRLAGRIRELGFENVIECDAWSETEISPDMSITIVPQDTNNISGIDADIVYDLDTSVIVRDRLENRVFYNNVDNPLSIASFDKIREFVSEEFDAHVNICCVPVGAASEFPQCFPKLDRIAEGRRLVDDALANFKQRMEALKPDAYFFAGGSYVVYGKFGCLNQYIAQPSMEQLQAFIGRNLDIQYLGVEGGQSTMCHDGQWQVTDDFTGRRFNSKDEAVAEYHDLPYDYVVGHYAPAEIDALFEAATVNYFNVLDRMKVDMRWIIDFKLYDDLRLTDEGFIQPGCEPTATYRLAPREQGEIIQELVCHMDAILFARLLDNRHIWNQSISGTHILYDREPNMFFPDVPSSLNFLRA